RPSCPPSPRLSFFFLNHPPPPAIPPSSPTRPSPDLGGANARNKPAATDRDVDRLWRPLLQYFQADRALARHHGWIVVRWNEDQRSEEHTSELQSLTNLVCRLLLEKKKKRITHQSQTR